MKLYHYSKEPLEELKTLRRQAIGENQPPEAFERLDEIDTWWTDVRKSRPYSKHISFFMEPLPVDLIKKHFPSYSEYKKVPHLTEHVVDFTNPRTPWAVVETAVDTFLVRNLAVDPLWEFDKFKQLFFTVKKTLRSLNGAEGIGSSELRSYMDKVNPDIKKSFQDWVDSDDFKDSVGSTYAASVPHLMLYPKDGKMKVLSTKKISFK